MERKMKRLNYRVGVIEDDILWKTQRMEALVAELKEAVAKYDLYQIVNFIPGRVREIEELYKEIRDLQEQKRIFAWITEEE